MTNNLDSLVYYVDTNIAENNRYLIERGIEPVPDPRAIESARKLKNYKKYSDFDPKGYVESYTKSLASGISERKLRKLYEEGTKKDIDEQIKNLRKTLERNDYVGLKEAGDFFNFVENNGEIKDDPYLNPNIGYFFDLPLVKEKEKNGILKKINKFVRKAAPVAAACLVAAIPVGIVGSANVASAQKDNSSQYPMIDLHDLPLYSDVFSQGSPIKMHVSGRNKRGGVTAGNIPLNHYEVLITLLDESSPKKVKTNSVPVFEEEYKFNKYLDSILSDAQRAGETGVKSLIPTPEGKFLDTISHGAYGKVSQINTIAQMGWYLQNISRTSSKMLEDIRNLPEKKKTEISQNIESSFNKKIYDAIFDYWTYEILYAEKYGVKPPDKPKKENIIKSFKEKCKVEDLESTSYYVYTPKGEYGPCSSYPLDCVFNAYLDTYGYTLPPYLDFVDISVTPTQKQNIKATKDLARELQYQYRHINTEYTKEYGSKRVLPEYRKYKDDVIRACEWYSQVAFKDGNTIVVPYAMRNRIKITPEEFTNYIEFLKSKIYEGHKKYVEKSEQDIKEVKNLKEVLKGKYGFLTRRFSDNYQQSFEILNNVENYLVSNKCIIEDFPIDEGYSEEVLKLKPKMKEEQSSSIYKILHLIETFGRKDTQDIFTNPVMIELRNKAIGNEITKELKRDYIELDKKESKKLGIPVYNIEDKGTYFFDNGKKEKITLKNGNSWPPPDSVEIIDTNTKKLVLNDLLDKPLIVYCDREDIIPIMRCYGHVPDTIRKELIDLKNLNEKYNLNFEGLEEI